MDAPDINDPQDTVEAIEDALGFGATTLGSSFDSETFHRTSNKTKLRVLGASAYLSGEQTDIVHATSTLVELNAEEYDDDTDFDTGSSLYTVPSTGKYRIEANLSYNDILANKVYRCRVFKNGTGGTLLMEGKAHSGGDATLGIIVATSKTVELTAGDTIGLWAFQSSGVNTVDISAGTATTFLTITLVAKD